MQVCRICLSTVPDRDISQLKVSKKDVQRRSSDIFVFCLGIEIPEHSKITRKLCTKCFRKVVSFYNFKTLALKSDDYLKAVDADCGIKVEILPKDEEEVGDTVNKDSGDVSSDEGDQEVQTDCFKDIKDEPEVKLEDEQEGPQSDDELLSDIKKVKEEKPDFVAVECKENAPVKKAKRGRPKVLKLKPTIRQREICEECGKSVWCLKEHAQKHLPKEERLYLQCKGCEKMFTSYGARRRHFKVKHLGIKQQCDICKKEVVSLHAHKLVKHSPESLRYPCLICKRRFIRPSILDSHMLMHTKERPFECVICQKKFRSALGLDHHKRQVHDKEKSHMCQFCSKSFFKRDRLMDHLRTHTKEKPYKCEECGKNYCSASSLRMHKVLHSGERNFACSYCDFTFARRGYLLKHIRCHTKEKPYPCKYCGVRFGRSDHRNRHQFTAHEKHLAA